MAKVVFSPEAEDKLIDKGIELKLNQSQRNEIKKLIEDIEKNPKIGIQNNYYPIKTDFAIEKHIGDSIFIILHYDISRRYNETTVYIKGLFLGYKM